jgi:hypothetical protein
MVAASELEAPSFTIRILWLASEFPSLDHPPLRRQIAFQHPKGQKSVFVPV